MTEIQATMISIFLVPVYIVLLRHCVTDPLSRFAKRILPPSIAASLTKQR